jgi:hypothetical protein
MLVLFLAQPAQLVQQAPVLPLKALLPRSMICLLQAIPLVIHTLLPQQVTSTLGMAQLGLMLVKSLVLQVQLVFRVSKAYLAQLALKAFRVFKVM